MVRSSLLLVMTLLEEPHATSLEDAGGLRQLEAVLWAGMGCTTSVLLLEQSPRGWYDTAYLLLCLLAKLESAYSARVHDLLAASGAEQLATHAALETLRRCPVKEVPGSALGFAFAKKLFTTIHQGLTATPNVGQAYTRSGLVCELVTWGERAAQASRGDIKVLLALEPLRELLVLVLRMLQAALEAEELVPDDALGQHLGPLRSQLQGLSKKQLRSRAAWEQLRRGIEAPLAACPARLAAAAAAADEAEGPGRQPAQQLRVARLLDLRPCANPACTNMRGASEARLHGRRCSGCGVARYCRPACQATAWPEHGLVCAALRAENG